MKVNKFVLMALTSLTLYGLGNHAALAEETASAPAFYVAEYEVTNPEGMKPYSAQVESTFIPYGGMFVVRGGQILSLEGTPPKRRRVVIRFENMTKAKDWYNSAEYVELRKIRQRSANTDVYLIEGLATPQ